MQAQKCWLLLALRKWQCRTTTSSSSTSAERMTSSMTRSFRLSSALFILSSKDSRTWTSSSMRSVCETKREAAQSDCDVCQPDYPSCPGPNRAFAALPTATRACMHSNLIHAGIASPQPRDQPETVILPASGGSFPTPSFCAVCAARRRAASGRRSVAEVPAAP